MGENEFPGFVTTDWLAEHLGEPDIRVFDCTMRLEPTETGYRLASGRPEWARAHIPGAGFLDLIGELSDRTSRFNAMMPPAAQFAEVMERSGVGEGTRVVLYDQGGTMWAARIWWMLRHFGFDAAAILSGGWAKWTAEGRPTSDAAPAYPPARFVPRPRAGLIADKAEVKAALDDEGVVLINALPPQAYSGPTSPYGRPGCIPRSVSVPAASLIDPSDQAFARPEAWRAAFDRAGALEGKRVIAYCGGGVAACSDAFALTMLGAPNVAVYDGSLSEWCADPDSPMAPLAG